MMLITDASAGCAFPGCCGLLARPRDRYCPQHQSRHCHSARNAARAQHQLRFIGVDGEGTGDGPDHRYVLLGVGDRHRTWPDGITSIDEPFSFLYECFEKDPDAVYVGFFLGYDFNMWFRTLDWDRAWYLLTSEGIAKRRARGGDRARNPRPHPVRWGMMIYGKDKWEFDTLSFKRLRLRPSGARRWMYICDAGPFFQVPLLAAADPARWPQPVCTPDEYALISEGKARRGTAQLGDDMIAYNRLENQVLARMMTRVSEGFTASGVRLHKDQWFGPGQAAQAWLRLQEHQPGSTVRASITAVRAAPAELRRALAGSYHGGWAEIMAHGHIPGTTYEYDINSAYPSVIAQLPCTCGTWVQHKGTPPRRRAGQLVLMHCRAYGTSALLGGLPFRRADGGSVRPQITCGWYWQDEVYTSRRAGLVSDVVTDRYWVYEPCGHPPPLAGITELYQDRLAAGKDTPQGKACKLVYNSVYGKTAQSLGEPKYASMLWASLITSGCRCRILDAIATHPQRAGAVVMVATDGVYFTAPHDGLALSQDLGGWDMTPKQNLTVFKPGVYWDDRSREQLAAGESVTFRARGFSAADFAPHIETVDKEFAGWQPGAANSWPLVTFACRFRQVSCLEAVRRTAARPSGYGQLAGRIETDGELTQDSDPARKRDAGSLHLAADGIWRTRPQRLTSPGAESAPYARRMGFDDDLDPLSPDSSFHPDGPPMMLFRHVLTGEAA